MLDNEGYRHILRISIFIAFPRQQLLREGASPLRLFVPTLPLLFSISKFEKSLAYEEGSIFSSKKTVLLISMQKVVL
jgi:hypothetical protein